MNMDQISKIIRAANNSTLDLVDSLSIFSALAEVNNQARQESDLLTSVLRILLENNHVERCGLFLKSQDKLELVCSASWGEDQVDVQYFDSSRVVFTTTQGAIGRAIKSAEIVHKQSKRIPGFLDHDKTEASAREASAEVVGLKVSPASVLYVPLVNRGVNYGVLCLYHSKSDYFKAGHEHFFNLFTHFLTQVLINHRYTGELEERIHQQAKSLLDAHQMTGELQKQLHDISLTDELTGLPNRHYFCNESQGAMVRARRHERDFSCCLLEISNFRQLVDEQGLFSGDKLLVIIADILKLHVREGDILAYFRGEQFLLALPEVNAEGARQFAERIMGLLTDARTGSVELNALELNFGLSSNDVSLPDDSEQALEVLMQQADKALQAAKGSESRVMHFSENALDQSDQCIA